MVSVPIAADGFEWYVKGGAPPGEWQENADDQNGSDNGISQFGRQILVGVDGNPDNVYIGAYRVGPIPIAPGGRVTSFRLFLRPEGYFSDLDFRIRAIADPSVDLTYGQTPTRFAWTEASSFYSTSSIDGYTFGESWTQPGGGGFGPKLQFIANEVLAHPNWTNNGYIWFILNPLPAETGEGYMFLKAIEGADGTRVTATYEETAAPVITSVSDDDIVRIGEIGVQVVGTDLEFTESIIVESPSFAVVQNVLTKSSTLATFDLTGSFPLGSATLRLTSGGLETTKAITIADADGNTGSDTGTIGSALCLEDGHEYAPVGSGFPGTWESVASAASSVEFWPNQVITGVFSGNVFKSSLRIGPINLPQNQAFDYVRLVLPIQQCYAQTDFNIQAIADPDVVVGTGNIITGETLTTAAVRLNNNTWVNYNETGYWTPQETPKRIDVTDIFEEVIANGNWAAGKYVTFILDYVNVPFVGGITGVTATESTNPSSSIEFRTSAGPNIVSVSGDNIVSIDELNVGIVGSNLLGAGSLLIEKGAISEAQTITSNDGNLITFDLNTGAIVADTGYTLSFVINSVTYSTTIDIGATPGGTSISSVGANNRIRHEQTNVKISGTGLDNIGSINIFQGVINEQYPIKTQSATQLTFDFYRGKLKCGTATLRLIEGVANTDVTVSVIPLEGSSWVDIADATNRDDSLIFNSDPAFEVGDQIVYQELSDQGFRLNVSTGGVVVIRDGKQTNDDITFKVQSYDASTATWYEEELITYKPSGFNAQNELGGVSFFSEGRPLDLQTIAESGDPSGGDDGGGPVIVPGGQSEEWTQVDKTTNDEGWT